MAGSDDGSARALVGLVRLLPSAGLGLFAASLALLAAGAASPAAFAVVAGGLVGAVPAAVRDGLGSPAGDTLNRWLLAVGVLFVVDQALGAIRGAVVSTLGDRVAATLEDRVLAAVTGPVGIQHLEDRATLDRIELARGVAGGRYNPQVAVDKLFSISGRWAGAALAAVVVARWSPIVAVAILVAYGFLGQRARAALTVQVAFTAGQVPGLRRSAWFLQTALSTAGAKEVRTFGLGPFVKERFEDHWLVAMREVWKARASAGREMGILPVFIGATLCASLAVAVHSAQSGDLGFAGLVVQLQALVAVGAIASLDDDAWNLLHSLPAVTAAARLERELPTDLDRPSDGLPATGLPRQQVRFEGVGYTYPGRDEPVYRSLDLTIEAGTSVAIVGLNGAGKTTLVKLLARLLDPQHGRITVDGVDLRDLDPGAWQTRIAPIFQEFTHYAMTATDNVGLGALARIDDADALARAAEVAGADEVIAELPRGWDTVLAANLTDGVDLSGGQWQRIALARAVFALQAGAGILVLDEPAASLDVRAEAQLVDRFLELTAGCTSLVISHRFSTVRHADRIVVLEHGLVVEDGTHDSLVASGGRYADLFALQASRFVDDAEVAGDA